MKKLAFIVAVFLFIAASAYSQKACTFKIPDNKPRNDQYSKSSQADIDKSKKEMAAQASEFDKKKYQADTKSKKKVVHKSQKALRYY